MVVDSKEDITKEVLVVLDCTEAVPEVAQVVLEGPAIMVLAALVTTAQEVDLGAASKVTVDTADQVASEEAVQVALEVADLVATVDRAQAAMLRPAHQQAATELVDQQEVSQTTEPNLIPHGLHTYLI